MQDYFFGHYFGQRAGGRLGSVLLRLHVAGRRLHLHGQQTEAGSWSLETKVGCCVRCAVLCMVCLYWAVTGASCDCGLLGSCVLHMLCVVYALTCYLH